MRLGAHVNFVRDLRDARLDGISSFLGDSDRHRHSFFAESSVTSARSFRHRVSAPSRSRADPISGSAHASSPCFFSARRPPPRSGQDPIAPDASAGNPDDKEVHVEAVETYTSVLTALSVALLLVLSGLAKKQLVWKVKPASPRKRRRRSM
jgi:hypothetical protein